MALSTTARYLLRQRIAGDTGLRGLITGTATDSSTVVQSGTELVDARNGLGLLDRSWRDDRFRNAWVGLHGATTATTFEEARVLAYAPAEGKVTVGRTFAVTAISGTTPYELCFGGVAPSEINSAISQACRMFSRAGHWVLTGLVTDGDQETSGTANWSGTNATLAKTTTEAQVGDGEQSLTVTNSGANGYATSAADIPVGEGKTYFTFAMVRVTTGVASLVWRDITNGANIPVSWSNLSSVDAADYGDFRVLIGTFTTPEGCVAVRPRLTNSSATGVAYWDDVCLYDIQALAVPLPTFLTDPDQQILDLLMWQYVNTGYRDRQAVKIRPLYYAEGNPTAQTAFVLPIPQGITGPLVVYASRTLTEPTSDSSTIPTEYADAIVAGALWGLYQAGARPRGMDDAAFATERSRMTGIWQAYQRAYNPKWRTGSPVRTRRPAQGVLFNRRGRWP